MKDERKIGAILGYIHVALQAVIGIVYVPLLLRTIGKAEFGLYQIVSSIIAYFVILETTLSATVLRHYTVYLAEKNRDKMENLLFVARKLFRILSLILVILAVPATFIIERFYQNSFSDSELRELIFMFAIMIANLVIALNNYVYLACITAHQKFVFLKVLGIVTLIVQPVAVVVLMYRVPYATMVVLVQVVLSVATSIIRYLYCKNKIQITIKKHEELCPGLLRELWLFSAGILLTTVADQIFWKTDQIILAKMGGTSIVACYSVGVQLFNMYMSLAAGIGSMLLPTVIMKVKNGGIKSADVFFRKIGRIQFLVMGLVLTGVIAFGREFIGLWVGDEYISAYHVALWLMIPYTIDIIQGTGLSILQAVNKYDFRAKCMFIISIINIGLTIALVLKIGIEGAAIATAISILFGSGFIMNVFYKRKIGLDISEFWKQMFPILLLEFAMVAAGYFINYVQLKNEWITFIVHGMLFVLLYCVLSYRFVMNQFEKEQVSFILKKIKRA